MATYTYGVYPFTGTTFTSLVAGSSDVITAKVLADFTIDGNGGNDVVTTAGGNDTITTYSGNDKIAAGDGNNTVTAGDGKNVVTTGSGNDTITTGSGDDVITGGDGNNTVDAGAGKNAVTTGSGNDTTGAGADTVKSGAGDDTIDTGSGNDIINSGGGADIVHAGAGNDKITSGGGIDSLFGGGGHDTFVFGSLADAMSGPDTIGDFKTDNPKALGEGDVLDIRGLVDDFKGLHGGQLNQLVASGHLDFSGDSNNTVISYDSNGSAVGGDVGVLVTLVGVPFSTDAASLAAFADNFVV